MASIRHILILRLWAISTALILIGVRLEAKSWVAERSNEGCLNLDETLSSQQAGQFARLVASYSNSVRHAQAKSSLHLRSDFNRAAKLLALDLSAKGYISHDGFPEHRNELLRHTTQSKTLRVRAENLAKFKSCSSDPLVLAKEAFRLWIASASHRKTILGPYQFQGVSITSRDNWYYATALFY